MASRLCSGVTSPANWSARIWAAVRCVADDDRAAGFLGHGGELAGQERFVGGGFAVGDGAVGGNAFAGFHETVFPGSRGSTFAQDGVDVDAAEAAEPESGRVELLRERMAAAVETAQRAGPLFGGVPSEASRAG